MLKPWERAILETFTKADAVYGRTTGWLPCQWMQKRQLNLMVASGLLDRGGPGNMDLFVVTDAGRAALLNAHQAA